MKTPDYWLSDSLISKVLAPISFIYGFLTQLRLKLHESPKAEVPVICIGNITAGGTGKTPVSLAIARMLINDIYHPFFVTRGYGGKVKNVIVNNKKHTAQEVGDEPLLLSEKAPTVVNPNRYEGAKLAVKEGADLIIMDDGFQNPSLKKDLSFLVFDGNYGIGNGKIIPSGPLRETFENGIKRADALIILGKDKHHLAKRTKLPTFYAQLETTQTATAKNKVIAFAGIGHPQKFYNTLKEHGFNILKTFDFPDHHFYNKKELEDILAQAQTLNAEVYTTSKDFVKIPHSLKNDIKVLEVAVVWEKPETLLKFIKDKISKKSA